MKHNISYETFSIVLAGIDQVPAFEHDPCVERGRVRGTGVAGEYLGRTRRISLDFFARNCHKGHHLVKTNDWCIHWMDVSSLGQGGRVAFPVYIGFRFAQRLWEVAAGAGEQA
jgi:hypothetical protein